jgi:hypothetical protein
MPTLRERLGGAEQRAAHWAGMVHMVYDNDGRPMAVPAARAHSGRGRKDHGPAAMSGGERRRWEQVRCTHAQLL